MRRAAFAVTLLALPVLALPALAQVPHSCRLVQQCSGTQCNDNPGVTLMFEATPTGLISWDAAVAGTRVELTDVPGGGLTAWAGRAEGVGASVLMTVTGPDRIALSMHMGGTTPPLTALGECNATAPAPLSK